jgi:hypothetical protein
MIGELVQEEIPCDVQVVEDGKLGLEEGRRLVHAQDFLRALVKLRKALLPDCSS